jgi:hypothetical protein
MATLTKQIKTKIIYIEDSPLYLYINNKWKEKDDWTITITRKQFEKKYGEIKDNLTTN